MRRLRFLEPMTAAILSNHRLVAPFGLAGGAPGAVGALVERADGATETLGLAKARSGPGDVFVDRDPGRRRLRDHGSG